MKTKKELEEQIKVIKEERDELNKKLAKAHGEYNDYIIKEDKAGYKKAKDGLRFLLFKAKVDRGNIRNSKLEYDLNKLYKKEMKKFIGKIKKPYLIDFHFQCDFHSKVPTYGVSLYEEIGIGKLKEFITKYRKELKEGQKETLSKYGDFKGRTGFLIGLNISSMVSGISYLYIEGRRVYNAKMYHSRLSLGSEVKSLEDAYKSFVVKESSYDEDEFDY